METLFNSLLSLLLAGVIMVTSANAQETHTAKKDSTALNSIDLTGWPEASRIAATEMLDKYGQPDAASKEILIWLNKGQWKMIKVSRAETKHSFPVEHTDMLLQAINYNVPVNKIAALAKFDGSITVDRTQGLISARCDKEANNLLALNLANDIITGKKTVEQARQQFARMVQQKMNGGKPDYMERLQFTPPTISGDADVNTTGLSKSGDKKTGP